MIAISHSAPAENPAPSLDAVFGGQADRAWKIASGSFALTEDRALGRKIFSIQKGPLALEGQAPETGEREIRALVRLPTDLNPAVAARFSVAKQDVQDAGLFVSLAASSKSEIIHCAAQRRGKPLHDVEALTKNLAWLAQLANTFDYQLRAYGPGTLYDIFLPACPEDFRRRVEADMSRLPGHNRKWLDVRIELRRGRVCFWLDDRLVAHQEDPALSMDGLARIELDAGAQIASYQTLPLAPAKQGFLPIRLAGYANARAFLPGQSVAALLPSAEAAATEVRFTEAQLHPDTTLEIDGVSFVFSGVNLEGNDHLDIGKSLYRQANSDEYIPTYYQPWIGSAWRDPARIQLRVPNGQYDALYLLAASDNDRDEIPLVTAMFYRPSAGFSEHFEATVPFATPLRQSYGGQAAKSSAAAPFPVTLSNGRKVNLWLVKIPLDPGKLSAFADLDIVEVELTKKVYPFRSYPDPIVSGWHQGGRPSAVHVYAATLGEAPVGFDFQPDRFGHVWTAPEVPGYTAAITNRTGEAQSGKITLRTRSYDGTEETSQEKPVQLGKGQSAKLHFAAPVKLNGDHDLFATLEIAGRTWTEKRSLVRLAPDTRSARWTDGKGTLFGFWSSRSSHYTPKADPSATLMTLAGARTSICYAFGLDGYPTYTRTSPDHPLVQKHWAPIAGAYEGKPQAWAKENPYDPKKYEAYQKEILAPQPWKNRVPEKLRPDFMAIFGEPYISNRLTSGNHPEYWGETPYEWTDEEKERIRFHGITARCIAEGVRKTSPQTKILFPYADPLYVVPHLRAGFPKDLIDGVGLDDPNFARLPEQQLHQISLHRLYELRKEFEKFGKPNPLLYFTEGVFVPTEVGACSWREQMDLYNRCALISMAYGVTRFYSGWPDFDLGDYYGAEQYGGNGIFRRIPYCDPKPAYAAYATLTDKLNEANFDGWLKTGSLTTYCLRFKHETRGFIYALWTLRGRRPVTLTLATEAEVFVTDAMNNAKLIKTTNKKVTITTDPSVAYVTGAEVVSAEAGEPLHPEARPAEGAKPVADLGDGGWHYTSQPDLAYENNNFDTARYPGRFSSALLNDAEHGRVLASKLEKQRQVHELMPWYNVLKPKRPILLPGAPSHIGLWVKGASDWGRVVYDLRDAKGERWISIGTKDQWNCDDMHSWSSFNFDGWRYLRFELPGHTGSDHFRKLGTTWWGSHDGLPAEASAQAGDGVVDLPLKLEAIIVEQRSHILYVNDVQAVAGDTVCFGKLYTEYASPEDATDEAVRLAKLQMPPPAEPVDLPNPIQEMAKDGAGEPTTISKLAGTDRGSAWDAPGSLKVVHFKETPGAKTYFVWMSAHGDGRDAINITPSGVQSGATITGMRPGIKLYYWATWTDAEGRMSKPSAVYEDMTVWLNPIEAMTKNGVGEPAEILKLQPPEWGADGTKAHVHFKEKPGAKAYFLWVSAHPDGKEAVNLTPAGVQPGALVTGMRAGIKLYYWATYTDAEGKMSKPSAPREETLVDAFKEK
ncbi:MAG: hypothetical protein HY360_03855 [Verrucomicrobia bacterium]|nr:hypothetical protein [Verrucomicrobiota bacterium]